MGRRRPGGKMSVFEGKVALVTGAGSGIGRATAQLFAERGASVACLDRDAQGCDETVALIEGAGGEALAIRSDVNSSETCREAVQRTVERFGRLDHAFNNAGVRGQWADPWNEEGIINGITVNLYGVIWGMKHQIAYMLEHGGGTIVNTSSIAGISGNVGALDYTAAKHGVVGFSKASALRYGAAGVRINVVCPGLIQTGMSGPSSNSPEALETTRRLSPILHRNGEARDIAEAVTWLSSPFSKFIFGVALPVDGGFSIN
jgi:NAD(P)-dependent dehydrogenase (short-subunit alcohol dehydrogenase family)